MIGRAPAAAAVTLGLAVALSGCQAPAPTTIAATGRVLADSLSIQAPALAVPRVSLDAGFTLAPGAPATTSTVAALLSFGSAQRVAAVEVKLGDRVESGDVLIRFDDAALGAQVVVAKADLAVAKAQPAVIDAALDTLADKQDDLRDKRREVTDGIAKATKARRTLAGKLADARKAAKQLLGKLATVEKNLRTLKPKLAGVEAQLGQLKAQLSLVETQLAQLKARLAQVQTRLAQVEVALAALPPDAPPGAREPLLLAQRQLAAARPQLKAGVAKLTTVRAQLPAGIAQLSTARTQLKAGIARLNAARPRLTAGIGQLQQGIGQLTKAIATIDANLAKARDGIRKIDDGLGTLRDARAGLKRNRKLAVIAARDTTKVDSANVAKGQAVVRAPADGVVTSIVHAGDVVAPGATVAELARPAAVVTTWLAPEQAAQVCLDAAATVTLDSLGAPLAGRVSRILPLAAYPPSYHTTDQVHLTRAVGIEVRVASALPPGVPADLQLSPCPTTR